MQTAEGFTKPLEVHDLTLSQEADRIADIGIFDHAQDIVICGAGFLFCRHVLHQIGDRIAAALELGGAERHAAGCLRPDTESVIHIVCLEAAVFDFLHGEVFGELMHGKGGRKPYFIELGGTPRWINLYAVADADVYYNYEV